MNPLTAPIELPLRLGSRVMRDLDAMADVARSVPRAIALLESLDRRAGQVLELGERIDRRAEAMLELGQSLDRRADAILTLGGKIDERGAELGAIGSQMLTEAKLVQERAAEVVAGANEMIAVLPSVRRAIEIGEPLEGAIERFARVVDRLPGGVRGRATDTGEPGEPPAA